MFSVISLFSLLATIGVITAHGRWKCPLPRDEKDVDGNHIVFENTANKYAACGPMSGQWGFGTVTTLAPGWTTLTWEESVSHQGAPFRLAILDETETARIVLLDHIPHYDASAPVPNVESTYVPYKISVNIPDVKCEKCSLQFLYVMTDKSVKCNIPVCYYNASDAACKGSTDASVSTCAGAPNDNVCLSKNLCFSNYHSCTDVSITGSHPLSHYPLDSQPSNWPYSSAQKEMLFYGSEATSWKDGWLQGVPSNFTTDYGNLKC